MSGPRSREASPAWEAPSKDRLASGGGEVERKEAGREGSPVIQGQAPQYARCPGKKLGGGGTGFDARQSRLWGVQPPVTNQTGEGWWYLAQEGSVGWVGALYSVI